MPVSKCLVYIYRVGGSLIRFRTTTLFLHFISVGGLTPKHLAKTADVIRTKTKIYLIPRQPEAA